MDQAEKDPIDPLEKILKQLEEINKKTRVADKPEKAEKDTNGFLGKIAGVTDKVVGFPSMIGDKIRDAFNASGIGKLASSIGNIAGKATGLANQPGKAVGGAVSALSKPLDLAGGAASAAINPATEAISKISSAFSPLVGLVEHINPLIVQQFSIAFDDLMAVLGDALAPILKAGTELVRKFADVLETMRPAIDPIIAIIVKMIGMIAGLIEPIAQILVPILGVVTTVLENLVLPIFEKFVQALKWMAGQIVQLINWIIDKINFLIRNSWLDDSRQLKKLNYDDLEKRSSRGKAIREVGSYSAAELGAKTRRDAFGQTADWAQVTANNTGKTAEILEKVNTGVNGNITVAQAVSKQMEFTNAFMGVN